jgi:hypothetical protein
MRKINFTSMLVALLLLPVLCSGQVIQSANSSQPDILVNTENTQGTFYILCHSKVKEVFTKDIYAYIEQNRHETQERVVKYSEYTTFIIFSKDKISEENFVPVLEADVYKYEN